MWGEMRTVGGARKRAACVLYRPDYTTGVLTRSSADHILTRRVTGWGDGSGQSRKRSHKLFGLEIMASTRVKWIENKTFLGVGSNNNTVVMSSGDDGLGVGPMQMLLLGLGGCASIDVVAIMNKQRQPLAGLEVLIEGERSSEGARPWRAINMRFIVTGDNLDAAKVQRAVDLSVEKYCGVHATLSGVATITHSVEIHSAQTSAESEPLPAL